MSDYWDVMFFKKTRNDKVIGVRLGSAKKRDDGGFWLDLNAMPIGEGSVAVVPQREKKGADPF